MVETMSSALITAEADPLLLRCRRAHLAVFSAINAAMVIGVWLAGFESDGVLRLIWLGACFLAAICAIGGAAALLWTYFASGRVTIDVDAKPPL